MKCECESNFVYGRDQCKFCEMKQELEKLRNENEALKSRIKKLRQTLHIYSQVRTGYMPAIKALRLDDEENGEQ